MFLTVFTPTYNRAHKLSRAYKSLKIQTFKDFEWLIIDDGSTDNTAEIVQSFIDESPAMNIRYFKIPHGGKHFAMNKSYEVAEGEFCLRIDSDDALYNEHTLKMLYDTWNNLTQEEQDEFSGIGGYFIDQNDNILGHHFKEPTVFDLNSYKQVVFEHKYVLNTPTLEKMSVLKSEPFPEIRDKNLNYFPEWIIWMRVYTKHNYKLLIIPEPIYRYYLDSSDSVSKNTPATKSLFYQTLYQLNEWYPIFKDEYPEFFKPLPQILNAQRKLWNVRTNTLLEMLTPCARMYYLRTLFVSRIFNVNLLPNRIKLCLIGVKITINKNKKHLNP